MPILGNALMVLKMLPTSILVPQGSTSNNLLPLYSLRCRTLRRRLSKPFRIHHLGHWYLYLRLNTHLYIRLYGLSSSATICQ
jgi:hypothetical protein